MELNQEAENAIDHPGKSSLITIHHAYPLKQWHKEPETRI